MINLRFLIVRRHCELRGTKQEAIQYVFSELVAFGEPFGFRAIALAMTFRCYPFTSFFIFN
jgi:hypothetical protein